MRADEMDELVGELMKEAGIEELACKPDPSTGELVCTITDEQAVALKKIGFEPRRVVFEIQSNPQAQQRNPLALNLQTRQPEKKSS